MLLLQHSCIKWTQLDLARLGYLVNYHVFFVFVFTMPDLAENNVTLLVVHFHSKAINLLANATKLN